MILFSLFLLLLLHFITGYGLLRLFHISLRPLMKTSLAVLVGVLIASLVPFLLQLVYIPITKINVFGALAAMALLLNIKTITSWKKIQLTPGLKNLVRVKLYEIPSILVLAFLLFVSAWRCYYYPSYVRDGLSGPETIADYAIKEHTLINSVFSVNLESTNNQFKSPYLTDLQIIYKMAGFPFGNMWVSIIAIAFTVFLYQALCRKLHPVLAGALSIIFIATPELYGYTFMGLYDYGCMVFFFLGSYFLFEYFKLQSRNFLYFSSLMFAFSVFVRSETLVLIAMLLPAFIFYAYRNKLKQGKVILNYLMLMAPVFVAYFIPVQLYNNHYLPQEYKIDDLFNKDLLNLSPFWHRVSYIVSDLIFSEKGKLLWNYFFYIFSILFLAELLFKRKFNREALNWLYAVLVVFIGLPLLGFLFPLMDLDNSTKRGLFRILPLMVLYLGNNQFLLSLSDKMKKWEHGLLLSGHANETKPTVTPAFKYNQKPKYNNARKRR